jgi:hypothetical protein
MWDLGLNWRVMVQPADGDAYGEWLCETYSQARSLCDGLQDKIMDGTTDIVSAWVVKVN